MINIRRPLTQAALSTAGAVALLAGGAVVAPTPAQAGPATWGRACMFNAVDGAHTFGHAGWAFKVRGDRDHWIYGATEGNGNYSIDPGRNTNHSWIKSGEWTQMLNHFRRMTVKQGNRWVREYTHWRCTYTRDGDARKAQAVYLRERDNGFNGLDNNCLIKSLKIFKGYSAILARDSRLPVPPVYRHPTWNSPNVYFREALDQAHWERVYRL
ncbi:hypothetical protein [Streptomyces chartreusis]